MSSAWPSCRGRLQLLLADRGHVRDHRAGRAQLRHHLQALPQRRRRLRQRAPPLGGHFHRRRVSAHRRLHRHRRAERALGVHLPRHAAPGDFRRPGHRGHRRAQSARAEKHRRAGRGGVGADVHRRGRSWRVLRAAPGRGDSQRPAAERRVLQKLERPRGHRARALGRGGHCQRHGRHEARPRQLPRAAQRDEDGQARAALDRAGSVFPDRVPRPRDARARRAAHGRRATVSGLDVDASRRRTACATTCSSTWAQVFVGGGVRAHAAG